MGQSIDHSRMYPVAFSPVARRWASGGRRYHARRLTSGDSALIEMDREIDICGPSIPVIGRGVSTFILNLIFGSHHGVFKGRVNRTRMSFFPHLWHVDRQLKIDVPLRQS